MLDLNGETLPALAADLERRFPQVKVRPTSPLYRLSFFSTNPFQLQVTPIEADAASESAISSVCERAIKEHGR